MKQLNRYGVLAVTLLFMGFSVYLVNCTKKSVSEEVKTESSIEQDADSRSQDAAYWLSLVTKDGNRLKYQDAEHFYKVYEALTQQVSDHFTAFEALHQGLTESQISAAMDAEGFDPDQPLQAFENSKGFLSQREATDALLLNWVNQNPINKPNFPSRTLDPVLGTMINEDGQYSVGIDIGKIEFSDPNAEDGLCIPVGSGNSEILFDEGNSKIVVQIGLTSTGVASILSSTGRNFAKFAGQFIPTKRRILMEHKKDPNFKITCDLRVSFTDFHNSFKDRHSRTLTTWRWLTVQGKAYTKVGITDARGFVMLESDPTLTFEASF